MRYRSNIKGFSLLELMISLAIGMTLVAGVLTIYTGTIQNSSSFVSLTKLDQELQSILKLITSEAKRAGYDGDASVGTDTNFGIDDANSTSTCLLYSYDSSDTGSIGTKVAAETYGIRKTGTAIQYASSTSSCTSGTWNAINDTNNISISNLVFTLTKSCVILNTGEDCTVVTPASGYQTVKKYQLDITIAGYFTNNPENVRSMTTSVIMHNDILSTQP